MTRLQLQRLVLELIVAPRPACANNLFEGERLSALPTCSMFATLSWRLSNGAVGREPRGPARVSPRTAT
ncbi:MAG: hypothetical protein KatS3mg112_0810 [Thermogutta sp.]|nr:MAG: hypothetical protein KatS3mg112_0810 [Thermogutta sp.]